MHVSLRPAGLYNVMTQPLTVALSLINRYGVEMPRALYFGHMFDVLNLVAVYVLVVELRLRWLSPASAIVGTDEEGRKGSGLLPVSHMCWSEWPERTGRAKVCPQRAIRPRTSEVQSFMLVLVR
jgi:hypothetical protein